MRRRKRDKMMQRQNTNIRITVETTIHMPGGDVVKEATTKEERVTEAGTAPAPAPKMERYIPSAN